jgi:hypothetical protein
MFEIPVYPQLFSRSTDTGIHPEVCLKRNILANMAIGENGVFPGIFPSKRENLEVSVM